MRRFGSGLRHLHSVAEATGEVGEGDDHRKFNNFLGGKFFPDHVASVVFGRSLTRDLARVAQSSSLLGVESLFRSSSAKASFGDDSVSLSLDVMLISRHARIQTLMKSVAPGTLRGSAAAK
jgi:hypothetical protein